MKTILLDMQNLEGVRGGRRKGEWLRTASQLAGIIKRRHVATGAGDTGALDVYLDDAGQYHCEFMCHRCSRNKELFTSQAKARAWLKQWMPRLNP